MVFIFQSGQVYKTKEPERNEAEKEGWQNTRDSIISKTAPYVNPVVSKLTPVKKTVEDSGTDPVAALEVIVGGAIVIGAISAFRRRGTIKDATLPRFAITLQEQLERLVLENTVQNPNGLVGRKFRDWIKEYAQESNCTYADAQKKFVELTLDNIYGKESTGDVRTSLKTKKFMRGRPFGKDWKNFWKRRLGLEKRLPGAVDAAIRQMGAWDFNYSEYLTVRRLGNVQYAKTIDPAANARTTREVLNELKASGIKFKDEGKTLAEIGKYVESDKYALSLKENGRSVSVMRQSGAFQIFSDNMEGMNTFTKSVKAFSKKVLGDWKSGAGFGGSEYAQEYRRQIIEHIKGNFGKLFFDQEAHVINKAIKKNPNFWDGLAEEGTIGNATRDAIRAGVRWPEALVNEGGAREALEKHTKIAKMEKSAWDTWSPYWKMSLSDRLMAGWWKPEDKVFIPGLKGRLEGKVIEGMIKTQIHFKSIRPNNAITRGAVYAAAIYTAPPLLTYTIPPVAEYLYDNPETAGYAFSALLAGYSIRSFYNGRWIRGTLAAGAASGLTYILISGPSSVPVKQKKIDPNQKPDYSAKTAWQDPDPWYKADIKKGILLEGETVSGAPYTKGRAAVGIDFTRTEFVEYYFISKAPPPDMSNVPELRIYEMNGNMPARNTGLLSIRLLPNGVAYGQDGMIEYVKNGRSYVPVWNADLSKAEDISLRVRVYKDGKCGIIGWTTDGQEVVPYKEIDIPDKTAWNGIVNSPPGSYKLYETVRIYPAQEKK